MSVSSSGFLGSTVMCVVFHPKVSGLENALWVPFLTSPIWKKLH